ncbi:hypothetical protein CKM354_000320300 [Cercospora kikuchii]|uniref:Amidohydrolase-related domain-containing protein n=1 Tax=Cercospora kikuchii TaxID=84275 RepID=A0A9P3CBQ6_9PEZI|nr:uncharacterized protein CKM354_000320300 [Cercospora kikuchii]GIZ39836.1 hypothetical protein CKM354_000320300 [Cercospora kikuchii]
MDKTEAWDGPPSYSTAVHGHRRRTVRRTLRYAAVACVIYLLCLKWPVPRQTHPSHLLSAEKLEQDYATCTKLRTTPTYPTEHRNASARYVPGTRPVLIRNATVWTGEPEADTGEYVWTALDVLLQNGLIKQVSAQIADEDLPKDYDLVDANGRQLTAGIIDMHSHTGVDSLPGLNGNGDVNELSEDITPFVRSLDGFNPLDHQIQVIKSGGVTTSLILPGSGNNIGGEAFVIKHAVGKPDGRPELSIVDLLADPEKHHRYIKMACGENAKNVYGQVGRNFGPYSRLGEAWYFRHAFEQAAALRDSQDEWCAAADAIGVQNMESHLPQDLKWETLAAVLRGQVMVNTHCYTIPDLESFIGYTNEFKFPVRAFHHAHSTFLIPEVLKRAYGGRAPAAALFADNMNYKAEAYVASEKAGKILHEAGITPVYVSDNPVLNAQHVLFEAAKAYRNGLPYHVALAGVTSASAELLGLAERIGKVKAGLDADVVLWDSDPLTVGATPLQVFIDGAPQFKEPIELEKPLNSPLEPSTSRDLEDKPEEVRNIVFTGISKIQIPGQEQAADTTVKDYQLVVADGKIACAGQCQHMISADSAVVALENGYITRPLTAFGSLLGLEEIAAEKATSDGSLDQDSFSAAIDGLRLEGRNLVAAYSHGVTRGITAPKFGSSQHKGLSVAFRTGAKNPLEGHAVIRQHVALHYPLTSNIKRGKTPTISTAIAELRSKLLDALSPATTDNEKISPEAAALAQVVNGTLPLVIDVHSADTTAALLRVKLEIEQAISTTKRSSTKLRLIILGGAESHLLTKELAEAKVGVILAPLFSYRETWEQRRALTGAPLTNGTAVDVLHAAGVKVAIGVNEDWEARDLSLQAGIVHANSGGKINETEAWGLASTAIYDILGIEEEEEDVDEFVVFEGNPLQINSQLRAVADGRGSVSVWS